MIFAICGWLIGFPLALFIKRNRNVTVVIGRKGPVFADNSKYFFIAATQYAGPDERIVFLTDNAMVRDAVVDAGAQAALHPSWQSLSLILRCGTLVVDMTDWFDFGVYPFSHGAKRVQIWHGAPLKRIELDLYRERLAKMSFGARLLLQSQKNLIGRYPVYDIVVATSQGFIEAAFKRCFTSRQFVACGYPRNDILLGWHELNAISKALIQINVDAAALDAVKNAKLSGRCVCLYVPTFRKDWADPFSGQLDLVRLSSFACRLNLLVVLKLHPFMQGRYSFDQFPNLLEYDVLGDVYPLMAECDLLITDYSSIFFDFLLLNRPIVFYAPDLETYVAEDRGMYFDYDAMTPGAKCFNYKELEQRLAMIIANQGDDGYADRRAAVTAYTHGFTDNQSGKRLVEAISAKNCIQ